MQDKEFLRRALRKVMQLWLVPSLTPEVIANGVDVAVNSSPPKHSSELLWASGKRFTTAHYNALVSQIPPSVDGNRRLSNTTSE